jgi:hypothetical protein
VFVFPDEFLKRFNGFNERFSTVSYKLKKTGSIPSSRNRVTRDRCYDLKNIFAKKIGRKIGAFDSEQR